MTDTILASPERFGPVRLEPGVRPVHALSYLYGAFAGITLTTFVSVIMPYVLNVNLAVPSGEQGRIAGDLVFYGEIVLLTMSGFFGALSDRLGRRAVFVGGLLLLAAGYALLGYVATLAMLIVVRVFMAFGITAVGVMVAAVQVDYPAESSRGRFVGFSGIAIGLGAVLIGVFFARLPDIYTGRGQSALAAGQLTMWTMAGYCALTALLLRLGLVGGRPPQVAGTPSLRQLLAEGFRAAGSNPRLLLAYACAFVGRADLVVVGTFYSLWLTQAGMAAGMSVEAAARTAGGFFALVMTVALLWAPVMGWLNDRLNRTAAMALALAVAALGYLAMGLITDPLGSWMYPAGALLGIGQMSVTSASQTLVGQESPPAVRGAVVGAFSLCGAAGILFVTSVGGRLYDAIAPAAPFVLIGTANGALAVWALWLLRKSR